MERNLKAKTNIVEMDEFAFEKNRIEKLKEKNMEINYIKLKEKLNIDIYM